MATTSKGTTLKFTPAGGEEILVGCLTSIGEITADSTEIDVTTLDSPGGYRETMQGWHDSGALEISGYHARGDAGQQALREAYESGKAGDAVIAFTDGCSVSFKAFVKSHSLGAAAVDGAIGFGATLRITGPMTVNKGE